jgi:hypothetical protein
VELPKVGKSIRGLRGDKKKEVRKACRDLWRAICNSINDLTMTARLHKALSRDLKAKLSSSVAPSGLRTESEEETLELLMTTHFPDSTPFPGVVASAAASRTSKHDCGVAAEMVTYTKVNWPINTFSPYKIPGRDGIFPALLRQGQRIVIPYLVKIFRACLATGYVPAIWRQVKVVFIPKPGKNSYTGPADFRPISLTSFLLKTLERLVDRYIRDEALVIKPLHPNQHAYQAGKSVGTALHQLVTRVEKVLDQRELALGVFLDMEGAYNYSETSMHLFEGDEKQKR